MNLSINNTPANNLSKIVDPARFLEIPSRNIDQIIQIIGNSVLPYDCVISICRR